MDIMQKTKTKSKALLIIIIVIAVTAVAVVSALLFKSVRLSRAIKKMDINNKASVVRVIKYANDDTDILLDIAQQYVDISAPEGAGILLHILQNVDSTNEGARSLLKEYYSAVGADEILINQVDCSQIIDFDFETVTEHNGIGYGGIDGIYCADFDGLVRFKISAARPKSLSAYKDGVYFLDSADSCLKTLSYDGAVAKTVLTDTSEFIFYESFIYSIDNNGKIHAPAEPTLNEGEFGANIRVMGDGVVCDVYNESYELIDTIALD